MLTLTKKKTLGTQVMAKAALLGIKRKCYKPIQKERDSKTANAVFK